jgi:hypothetical protein
LHHLSQQRARALERVAAEAADAVTEVQTVSTSADVGFALGGTFALSFNGVSTSSAVTTIALTASVPLGAGALALAATNGGSTATTACLPFNASEPDIVGALGVATIAASVLARTLA